LFECSHPKPISLWGLLGPSVSCVETSRSKIASMRCIYRLWLGGSVAFPLQICGHIRGSAAPHRFVLHLSPEQLSCYSRLERSPGGFLACRSTCRRQYGQHGPFLPASCPTLSTSDTSHMRLTSCAIYPSRLDTPTSALLSCEELGRTLGILRRAVVLICLSYGHYIEVL